MALLFLLLTGSALAQNNTRWEFRNATYEGTSKFGTRVSVDRWGNTHLLWGSQAEWLAKSSWGERNPQRAGIQLFYSNDATGSFSSPIQVTDTVSGTVYMRDSVTTPWVFRVDQFGYAHVAYIVNKDNRLRLYYISDNNSSRRFSDPVYIAEFDSVNDFTYDMAVDSTGTPHIVWMDRNEDIHAAKLRYWSNEPYNDPITTIECSGGIGIFACRVGKPEIEIAPDSTMSIFFRVVRGGKAGIYMLRRKGAGVFLGQWLAGTPSGAILSQWPNIFDLRMSMAVDAQGSAHIVLPYVEMGMKRRYQLLYLFVDSQAVMKDGEVVCKDRDLLVEPLDTIPGNIDIAFNTRDRIHVAWSTYTDRTKTRLGFAELAHDRSLGYGPWSTVNSTFELNALVRAPQKWRNEVRIASWGERVVLGGIYKVSTPAADQQVAVLSRHSTEPRISYILPDAAAPGMNVVVESYANVRALGSFGPDGYQGGNGLNPASVEMELVNRFDTARVVIGPAVVSWDGRLVSTMLFVKPGAETGPVPVRLRVGKLRSNVDTFFIVKPQRIGGESGELRGGGVLGSDPDETTGMYGRRSKRGVLVVESLILKAGIYTVDTNDTDPFMEGNQGFLPVTILSRGPVIIGSGAKLSVSAISDSVNGYTAAGPGGGGGGSGGNEAAGSGFTGGGGIAYLGGEWLLGESVGSGGFRSGFLNGGGSLNGTPGGSTYSNAPNGSAPAGGGTGHPFGTSGLFGQIPPTEPVERNLGGYGGGSGGVMLPYAGATTTGGGGGGHGTAGAPGGDNTGNPKVNFGAMVGSRHLVPIAGGGAGGAGGYAGQIGLSSGGSGGGALVLVAYDTMRVDGRIDANGSNGLNTSLNFNASGGGGGAGGGLLVGARGGIVFSGDSRLSAHGGQGGRSMSGGAPGGTGGMGRIRVDGRAVGRLDQVADPDPGFRGPGNGSRDTLQARLGSVISGFGLPDSTIMIFKRPEGGAWAWEERKIGRDSTWSDTLTIPGNGQGINARRYYIFVMQRVSSPQQTEYRYEPAWVMSPVSGIILGRPKIEIEIDTLDFTCIRFDKCSTAYIPITNAGEMSSLRLSDFQITGPGADAFEIDDQASTQFEIQPDGRWLLPVKFCPKGVGTYEALLTMRTNDETRKIDSVHLIGCGISGLLSVRQERIDLGELCIGDVCRDRTLMLRNRGSAPLEVTEIRGVGGVEVTQTMPGLPVTIQPGDSLPVSLRLCLNEFGDSTRLFLKSTTVDPNLTLLVHGVNASPEVETPVSIEFGRISVGKDDTLCLEREVTVSNRSASVPMKLAEVAVLFDSHYDLLDLPAPESVFMPGDGFTFRVRLCADGIATYDASLRMLFSNGPCSIERLVPLHGEGTLQRARYIVTDPAIVMGHRTLDFGQVLENVQSMPKEIRIENIGDGMGEPITISNSNDAEFETTPQGTLDGIDRNGIASISVRLTPRGEGVRTGTIVLTSGSWRDTIELTGFGTRPGLQVEDMLLDVGTLCIGEEGMATVRIFNNGTAPVTIDRVTKTGDRFQLEAGSTLPTLLAPGQGDSLRYLFRAESEGEIVETVTVHHGGATKNVVLKAKVETGHISIETSALTFGCNDSVRTFTLTNPGNCDVEVTELRLVSTNSAFSINRKSPFTIPARDSVQVPVRYSAGTVAADATLDVISSAPEPITLSLHGDVCLSEITKLTISLPEAGGDVGSSIYIPVSIDYSRPMPVQDIAYTIVLRYAADILMPRLFGKIVNAPSSSKWGEGTVSDPVQEMTEVEPGTLRISGTIKSGKGSGVLVNVPFLVLLGRHFTTDLTVESVEIGTSGITYTTKNGSFTALNCDTSSGVVDIGIYSLEVNVPNPFQTVTTIPYTIGRSGRVIINLYDVMGNFVRTILDEEQEAGYHEFRFDATGIPKGAYTYELISGQYRATKRMNIK